MVWGGRILYLNVSFLVGKNTSIHFGMILGEVHHHYRGNLGEIPGFFLLAGDRETLFNSCEFCFNWGFLGSSFYSECLILGVRVFYYFFSILFITYQSRPIQRSNLIERCLKRFVLTFEMEFFYQMLVREVSEDTGTHFPRKASWKTGASPKVVIFSRKAVWDRILTNDHLQKGNNLV